MNRVEIFDNLQSDELLKFTTRPLHRVLKSARLLTAHAPGPDVVSVRLKVYALVAGDGVPAWGRVWMDSRPRAECSTFKISSL